MELRVADGTVYFARYKLEVSLTSEEAEEFGWCYAGGIYAASDEEKSDVEARLTTLGKSFSTSDISPTQAQLDKKTEIDGTVLTRSEALAVMP